MTPISVEPGARVVVCARDDRSFLECWGTIASLAARGAVISARGVTPEMIELLPESWRGPESPGRPDLALWTDRSPRCLRGALAARARRWGLAPRESETPSRDPVLDVPEADRDWARARLGSAGLHRGEAIVGLRPGVGRVGFWVRATREIRRRAPAARPVLLVRPDRRELWTAVRIHERVARAVPVLGSEASIGRFAALVAEARVVVGPEDGVLALASLLRVPVLVAGGRISNRSDPGAIAEQVVETLERTVEPGGLET